jgi:hypothetical protein
MVKEQSIYEHFKGERYIVTKRVFLLLPDSKEAIPAVVYHNKEGVFFCRYESDFLFEGLLSDGTIGNRFKLLQ